MKKAIVLLAAFCLLLTLFSAPAYAESAALTDAESAYSETIDMSKWQYNASDDVYWQIGIQYCANPADITFETLGIFVPGAYFDAVDNGDGTFTCTVSETGTLNGYTAQTAPILLPVNTAGHKSQAAPTGYSKNASSYTGEGFVYVAAGCRKESASETYETAQDYIDALNKDGEWVTYDAETGDVTIKSIYDFSTRLKVASKPVAAFDKLEKGGHELFSTGDCECTHFDAILAEIVKGTEYEAEFEKDLSSLDALGNTMEYRLRMFSPLSYLLEANEDYGTAQVADYWRIRSGITQSDTPLTTELNLALALNMYGADVDFETVWNQGHTQAERTGSSDANFISWVHEIFE